MIPFWLSTVVYVVGYLLTARGLYVEFDRQSGGRPKPGELSDKGWAAFMATIWPVVLLFSLIGLIIFRETPRQRAVREAEERATEERALAAAEKTVAEFGSPPSPLPPPGDCCSNCQSGGQPWAHFGCKYYFDGGTP